MARLVRSVRDVLASQASDVRLDAECLSVEPILNWGGFVNRSFRISDGRSRFFLKLAPDRDVQRGLKRWRELAPILEYRYHAPRMAGWLDMEDLSACGALFDWIDGTPLANVSGTVGQSVIEAISRLHADAELTNRLAQANREPLTCSERYLGTYHERFMEDLATIENDLPPFLDEDDFGWMRLRVAEIESMVRGSVAFQEPAACPVHGDLWLNNTLADPSGRWYLLDWDGLGLGDPVADWAMLFGPSRARVERAGIDTSPGGLTLTGAQRERLAIYARASLLDWVIDPLADWVQAGAEPEHGSHIRQANETVHMQAIRAYRERFGE